MPHLTKPISDPMKAALLESFQASIDLVPDYLRPQFILVGAAASIAHGSRLWTEDVDIAGSVEAITAFRAAIDRGGTRFHICPGETIEFDSRLEFRVRLELLQLGGPFVESVSAVELLGGFVAGLPDLIWNRAKTIVGRGEDGDIADFKFLLAEAEKRGLTISLRDDDMRKVLEEAGEELTERERSLLQSLMKPPPKDVASNTDKS